jgi:2-polyprenyl-3-methyl-5-hydroxy-6-metoxy-1,4-benzoquinol methylase
MNLSLTPHRRRGIEILDDPGVSPDVMERSMADVERANVLLGGTRAALRELEPVLGELPKCATLLDVGTGTADIPAAARTLAAQRGVTLRTIGFDLSPVLVERHRRRNDYVVRGNALQLPFRDNCIDIVMCSQVLHHFPEREAQALIAEMNRVARARVVISDLRRSLIAAGGLWLASFLLSFHSVSRHDGVVSIMRGFVPEELSDLVQAGAGTTPAVHRRPGFRITTSWKPA